MLTVYRQDEIAELSGISYIKTKANKQTYLWHSKGTNSNGDLVFELIKPLGNNGEYLEMSISEIKTPLSDTTETTNDVDTSNIQEKASDLSTVSTQEESAEEDSNSQVLTKTDEVKNLSALADLIMKQNPNLDKDAAMSKIENIKENPRMFAKFLQNVFKQKGLDLNIDEAINEFKKYC